MVDFSRTSGGSLKVIGTYTKSFSKYDSVKPKEKKKEEVFKFEDILTLRNKLAKVLETACEVFPS